MKHRLAEGCLAYSFAGKQVAVGSDGTVELDAAAAAALLPHGAVPAGPADRVGDRASGDKRSAR